LNVIASLIRSVDIFRSLTDRELSRLADVAEAVSVPAQKIIIRQGDEADAMYVLMAY
jgi:CRP-like cAMP-binding protein